jgi:hypothetical protein
MFPNGDQYYCFSKDFAPDLGKVEDFGSEDCDMNHWLMYFSRRA